MEQEKASEERGTLRLFCHFVVFFWNSIFGTRCPPCEFDLRGLSRRCYGAAVGSWATLSPVDRALHNSLFLFYFSFLIIRCKTAVVVSAVHGYSILGHVCWFFSMRVVFS